MTLPFTTLDVFTTTPYLGNPLAVIRVPNSLRDHLTEEQKQKIAREFNLSEVTFLHEPTEDSDTVNFDIFTSKARITFAGHPTIGTAIYVAQHASAYPGITSLCTLAGTIPFKYDSTTSNVTVAIPDDVHIHASTLPNPNNPSLTVPIVSIVKGMSFALCQLPDLATLSTRSGPLIPPQDRYKTDLLDVGSGWDVGYTGSFYFVDLGTDDEGVRQLRTRSIPDYEDPGTGSASGALCCYLAITEGMKGLQRFKLVQGVDMGRRCDIWADVEMRADGSGVDGVKLSGTAVEVMEGTLRI